MLIDFVVTGEIDRLKIPAPTLGERTDDLWQGTCFETFISLDSDEGYLEYNFSPSSDWAIYVFEGYRDGMMPEYGRHVERSWTEQSSVRLAHTVLIELDRNPSTERLAIGLSAVIEETDGTKSYWALRHPPGKPDFHHPDCFALTLGAPESP